MNNKLIYENKKKYYRRLTIEIPNRLIDRQEADKLIQEYGHYQICGIALKYYDSIFNYHNWKEITYFSNFAKKILDEIPNKSVIISPGCSPTKIIWLLNNIYRISENIYKCPDGSIKELIFVQFPLSHLFSSSSYYDNHDSKADLSKLDNYIKGVMLPYMKYVTDDIKFYYLDAMVSRRTYKLLSDSCLKLGINHLGPINILPYDNKPTTTEEWDKVYTIRNFVGNDDDRIIEKYNVFTGSRQYYDMRNGNLSLLVYYIAHQDPSTAKRVIQHKPFPELEAGKIYSFNYKKHDVFAVKIRYVTNYHLECIYHSHDIGFYGGFLDSACITKIYECDVNANEEDYKDKLLQFYNKVVEGNQLIKDQLLEFAIYNRYKKIESTSVA